MLHPSTAARHSCYSLVQAETPIEQQISRWRQEVFKLLLSSKQAQLAYNQQAETQAATVARLEQQVTAAEDKALLLDGRLLDRQVDLDLACLRSNRAEAQLQESGRYFVSWHCQQHRLSEHGSCHGQSWSSTLHHFLVRQVRFCFVCWDQASSSGPCLQAN